MNSNPQKSLSDAIFGGWAVLLLLIVLTLLSWPLMPWPQWLEWLKDNDKLAGWAQAFGAVATIAAGTAAVVWQVKTQARHDRARLVQMEIDALESAGVLLEYAHSQLQQALTASKDKDELLFYLRTTYRFAELRNLQAALDATHPREVPNPGMKLSFISGVVAFTGAHDTLQEMDAQLQRDVWNSIENFQFTIWHNELRADVQRLGIRAGEFRKRIDTLQQSIN